MQAPLATRILRYLPNGFKITTWAKLRPYYNDLLTRDLDNQTDWESFFEDWQELNNAIDKYASEAFEATLLKPENIDLAESHNYFVFVLHPRIQLFEYLLTYRVKESDQFSGDTENPWEKLVRAKSRATHHFNEENLELLGELQFIFKSCQFAYYKIQAGEHEYIDPELINEMARLRNTFAMNLGFSDYNAYMDRLSDGKRQFRLDLVQSLNSQTDCPHESKPTFGDSLIHKASHFFDLVSKILGNIHSEFGVWSEKLNATSPPLLIDRSFSIGLNVLVTENEFSKIYINLQKQWSDVPLCVHEYGHALHLHATKELYWNELRRPETEVSEMVAFTFEILSLPYWSVLGSPPDFHKEKFWRQTLRVLYLLSELDLLQEHLYKKGSVNEILKSASLVFDGQKTEDLLFSYPQIIHDPEYFILTARAMVRSILFVEQWKESSPIQLFQLMKYGGTLETPFLFEKFGQARILRKVQISRAIDFIYKQIW